MDSSKLSIVFQAFASAAAVGMVITLVAIPVGRRFGMATQPRLFGASDVPISYLGGPALVLAALFGFISSGSWDPQIPIILWAGLAVMTVGFMDDLLTERGGVAPLIRLAAEIGVSLAMWAGGIQASSSGPRVLDALITVVFLVGAMNAVNLLDNMDGVSSSTVIASAFGIASVAIITEQYALGTLAAAVGGACVAFLVFNLRHKIYLGDSGSLVLGLLLGSCALVLQPSLSPPGGFLVPVVLLAVPFTDTAYRQIRRKVAGGSLFDITGGTDHVSHALVDLGLTTREAAMIHAGTGFLAASAALFAVSRQSLIPLALAVAFFATLGLALVAMTRKSGPTSNIPIFIDSVSEERSGTAAPQVPLRRVPDNANSLESLNRR